jgi:hypothetical protein
MIISIVTNVLNGRDYLCACIESVGAKGRLTGRMSIGRRQNRSVPKCETRVAKG